MALSSSNSFADFSASPSPTGQIVVPYEKLLSQNLELAMSEGSLFFQGKGSVQDTLRNVSKRLEELAIPYAVVGGMALFAHGFRRYTEDIDILVTRDGLIRIHEELEGHGYIPPFQKSKHLRDTDTRVKIEFLTTGDYPGDGKEKPVSFPDPAKVSQEIGGIKYLNLPTLVTLKLASGMTNLGRRKDLADVAEVIKMLHLPETFADSLDLYVRPTFVQLSREVNPVEANFLLVWQVAKTAPAIHSIDGIMAQQPDQVEVLSAMPDQLESALEYRDPEAGYVLLTTTDPAVAEKFGMVPESDFFDARA